MSTEAKLASETASAEGSSKRIILVSYPKIVFMYPTALAALVAALYTTFSANVLEPTNTTASLVNTLFIGVFAINLVVIAFDFPRTTSLTLFFFCAALVLGGMLLFTLRPEWLPGIVSLLGQYHPAANATFYWSIVTIFGVIYGIVFGTVQFDYWEVRPNELLHHHGVLSNLERFSAPNLRIDKEVNDLFEYLLLQSGRLIMHPSNERRAIIIDNVPFISRKESEITRMLGALQVQVRKPGEDDQ